MLIYPSQSFGSSVGAAWTKGHHHDVKAGFAVSADHESSSGKNGAVFEEGPFSTWRISQSLAFDNVTYEYFYKDQY